MAPISSYIERERRKKEARELNAPYKKFRVYGKYSEQSLIDTLVDGRYQSNQLAKEDRFMLAEAIKQLRDGLREVVQLTFYEDLSQTEVARRLGISQMQVSRRLRAATAELYKIITQSKKSSGQKNS